MAKSNGRVRRRVRYHPTVNNSIIGTINVVDSVDGPMYNRKLADVRLNMSGTSVASVEFTKDQTNPGPPYITGGDFLSAKSTIPSTGTLGTGDYRSNDYYGQPYNGHLQYLGGFYAPGFQDFGYSDQSLIDIGTDLTNTGLFPAQTASDPEVWARLKPQFSEAGIGQALGEARDLPRMLQTSAKGFHDMWKSYGGSKHNYIMQPKKAADHFINTQFGWVPFANDISDLCRIFFMSQEYMARNKRNNNTWIKRQRVMSHSESEVVVYESAPTDFAFYLQPVDWMIQTMFSSAHYRLTLQLKTDEWAEGVFKYYRPEFDESRPSHDGLMDTLSRQISLYGARINPSLVYKITPWSWLIDWFSDVGTSIDNATAIANDALVSKYIYLMQRHSLDYMGRFRLTPYYGTAFHLDFHRSAETKRRRGGLSPYGLNLSWGDLSPTQLGVLTALGISRNSIAR